MTAPSRTGAGVRRVVLLTLGWEDLPLSVSIDGAPPTQRLREPVPGVLLLCPGGWLLLDTGFNPASHQITNIGAMATIGTV